jgi:distribution and morphology protein 10
MFGMRGLYNFGWRPDHTHEHEHEEVVAVAAVGEEGKRIDEEEMMEGGLRGRFSAGGEVYFSAQQRSFGGTSAVTLLQFLKKTS